jgi:hypothetical protein
MVSQEISPKVRSTVEKIVRRELGSFGVRSVKTIPSSDHDGTPILLIQIDYDNMGKKLNPGRMAELVSKLRNELWASGETRFPYIQHHASVSRKLVGYQ